MTIATKKRSGLLERLGEFENYFDTKEPRIHAFLPEDERFKRLRKEARVLERRYRKKKQRPPLYGLLLGVKDIFHVDGSPTRAGSRLPAGELKGKEAECVTQLKNAGVLISGKTVTTEFAYFAPGPTRNPHDTERTPGGSSSGSAAAMAAGMVDLALGTQTIGSIIRPAAYCGVVGFKPSFGRVSAEGVIPLARSLDHVGLFAHDVSMVKRGAAVICRDWNTNIKTAGKPYLAIPTGEYLQSASEEMRAHFEIIVERLKKAGYRVKTLDAFSNFSVIAERHQLILAAEAAEAHSEWYANHRHLYHEKTAALIEKGLAIPAESLKQALDDALGLRRDLSTLMDIHGIDLWISPAATGAAPVGLASTGDPVMNLPWTQAGFPTLGLPSGTDVYGMPLGLQLSANYKRDEHLLAWGAEIEKVMAE